jgi:hypothetical protein
VAKRPPIVKRFSEPEFPRLFASPVFSIARARGCSTVVVEENYVDRDHLEDFSHYYVRCFAEYHRFCKRLHFFAGDPFGPAEFLAAVERRGGPLDDEALRRRYQGFVVVRPLPDAVVGRTVLVPPVGELGAVFPTLRRYEPNLFGVTLPITGLAFQEQDTVLAACATTALWSALHKTADLFGSRAPSPSAVTEAATRYEHRTRAIPSRFLNVRQMCQAICEADLQPEVHDLAGPQGLLPGISLCYAYLCLGVPVVLGVEIEDQGDHAVVLTGFRLSPTPVDRAELLLPGSTQPLPLLAERWIGGFYAHDDQHGPFCVLDVGGGGRRKGWAYPFTLTGEWRAPDSTRLTLWPRVAIIPVYHKLRVGYASVLRCLLNFGLFVTTLRLPTGVAEWGIEWDVHLTTTNAYKAVLRSQPPEGDLQRNRLLLEGLPRFIWRATGYDTSGPVVEFLLDATDMDRSFFVREARFLSADFRSGATACLSKQSDRRAAGRRLGAQFVRLLLASTR